jgi:hypothetical protein
MDSKSILNEALQLRPAERLLLIEWLTKSLNKPDTEIEQVWMEESEKRYKVLKEGKMKTATLDEIIKRYK